MKIIAKDPLIDLYPLLAEIAAGTISDAQVFQAADEFLLLRDLLADDDFVHGDRLTVPLRSPA